MFKKSYFSKEPIFRLFKPPPSNANVLFISFVWNCIHRCHHCKHDVTTLHETLSAKLLSHDVISLECETKHTNLTLVNERQNNVTSSTNCPYLISTFIPLDVDKFGAVCFLLLFKFLSAERVFFQIRVTGLKFTKRFFFDGHSCYYLRWCYRKWRQSRDRKWCSHCPEVCSAHAQPEVAQYLRLWDRKWRLSCPHILLTFHSLIIRFVS
jgi:hypothetical protein